MAHLVCPFTGENIVEFPETVIGKMHLDMALTHLLREYAKVRKALTFYHPERHVYGGNPLIYKKWSKGVIKHGNRYYARRTISGKVKYFGSYATPMEAEKAIFDSELLYPVIDRRAKQHRDGFRRYREGDTK